MPAVDAGFLSISTVIWIADFGLRIAEFDVDEVAFLIPVTEQINNEIRNPKSPIRNWFA